MNTPPPSSDSDRRVLSKQPAKVRLSMPGDEAFVPVYVAVPPPSGSSGTLNIQVGVVMLVLALVLMAFGTILSGPRAILPVGICLAAFTLFWILLRLRVFQKRNGGFVALAGVCLLGSLVSFFERGYSRIEDLAKASANASATASAASPQAVEPSRAASPEPEAPLLSQVFGVKSADPIVGPRVRILKESRVPVGRRFYRVTPGESFPILEVRDSEVYFGANELRVSLPKDVLEVIGVPAAPLESAASVVNPEPAAETSETPAQVTKRAQLEAIRRYPALGVKDSPENQLFVETYRELRNSDSELLKDPEWPMDVAESLAKREGWVRK